MARHYTFTYTHTHNRLIRTHTLQPSHNWNQFQIHKQKQITHSSNSRAQAIETYCFRSPKSVHVSLSHSNVREIVWPQPMKMHYTLWYNNLGQRY